MLSGPALNSLNTLSALSSLRKYVVVTFLNAASVTLPAEGKTRVCDIEAQVVTYLHSRGMRDTELFGLAIRTDDEFLFVDGENKLSKYASRQWKASTNGLDHVGNPLLKLEYRVKYYLSSNFIIRDHVSRLHYYLQLRENVLYYGHSLQEEVVLQLASLALQADLGDIIAERHSGTYFDPSAYVPQWLLHQMTASYFLDRMPSFHRKLKGLSTSDAHAQYIREASATDSPHNIHLYHLRRKKHDPSSQVAVSICDKGIDIYEEDAMSGRYSKKLVQSFLWSNIDGISFDKKKFEIRAPCYAGKLTFFTSSDDKSRHLLQLCRLTHQFSRNQRWRSCDQLRSSSHDRRQRDSFLYNDASYQEAVGSLSTLGGCLGIEGGGMQRISLCSNSSSNTASGVTSSDQLLSLGGTQDLDRKVGASSSTVHSIESGVASITRSLSISSSTRTESPDQENQGICGLEYTPAGSPDLNSPSWDNHSRRGDGTGFGRSGSIHSSSSQHSASTVRSRYSLVPSRHRHELALGAQLADLSLAPDLPDLADLPAMAADMVARGNDVPDSVHHIQSTSHNCCSTCCDDNVSLASDEGDGERERSTCRCGSCNVCLLGEAQDDIAREDGLYMHYGNSEATPHQIFPTNSVFIVDDDSVVAQPDLDATIASTYNFSEEDFSPLDNNDDYVDFYKGGLRYQESATHSGQQQISEDDVDAGNLVSNAREIENPNCGSNLGGQVIRSQRSSPVEEEEQIDYSVESAQASLACSYPIHNTALPWALIMGSQNTGNPNQYPQPSPVPMSKITTITPVNIASSRCNPPSTSPEIKPGIFQKASQVSSCDALVSEATVADASEAPAKFITSKPRITVLKAHTQLAATTAPSFSSVPLTRSKIHTLPQVQYRPKVDAIQSLQRVALPDPRPLSLIPSHKEEFSPCTNKFSNFPLHQVPIIRANNYLDVHASSNLNRERLRAHPEQLPSKTPRSLYFKNQKKILQQQTIQLHQQLLNENTYQPSVHAQGVGVPLLPSPTYAGCQASKAQKLQHPHGFETHQSLLPQHGKHAQNIAQPLHVIPQQCYQLQPQPEQQDTGICRQNISYQPQVRNFFQNPPPPTPHPGYGIGVCPGNQSVQLSPELHPTAYQCMNEPGTYSLGNQSSQHLSQASLATVYTNQVTLSQIEQFKAQLNSDADYVIYPHKDPALSRQEYMDAKQSQVIANQSQIHADQQLHGSSNSASGVIGLSEIPPPYRSPKSSLIYRSTPNVAGTLTTGAVLSSYPSYQSLASTHQPGSSSGYSSMVRGRYFSQQSLTSSFSSAPSTYSASTQSLTGSLDPYADAPPIPHSPSAVMRVRSDESLPSSSRGLNELDSSAGFMHPINVPSRPPPPYRPKEVLEHSRDGAGDASPARNAGRSRSRPRVTLQQVRECGNQLDVPLLAALCSDSSLLAQGTSRSTSRPPKHAKSPKFSSSSPNPTSPSAASLSSKEPTLNSAEDSANNTPPCRYSLSGVYTTNQVPAPHITSKSSSKISKSSNGVHQHPKVLGRPNPKGQTPSQPHHGASSKLKHSKSIKEMIECHQR